MCTCALFVLNVVKTTPNPIQRTNKQKNELKKKRYHDSVGYLSVSVIKSVTKTTKHNNPYTHEITFFCICFFFSFSTFLNKNNIENLTFSKYPIFVLTATKVLLLFFSFAVVVNKPDGIWDKNENRTACSIHNETKEERKQINK